MKGISALLTLTSGGAAVHLAPESHHDGRGAVPEHYFDHEYQFLYPNINNYDRIVISEPRWSSTTLCGRHWVVMAGNEGGGLGMYSEAAFAPSCRRCLHLFDSHFPSPKPDTRLQFFAELAADALLTGRGFAEVRSVPGDQQSALRKAIRHLIRERIPESVTTYVFQDRVFIECRAIMDQHAGVLSRATMEALESIFTGNRPVITNNYTEIISWTAWDVG